MSESETYCLILLKADQNCVIFERDEKPPEGGTMKIPQRRLRGEAPAADCLPAMLAEGWIPVRETSLGNGDVLLVLSKGAC